jgi:hypothetical protein
MKSKFPVRLLKILQVASIAIAIGIALIWIILQGYSALWTGFGDYTRPNSEVVRGKTLWDWMQLFLVPLTLSIGVFFLNRAERESEREITKDRQRETALQTYLDHIVDLLISEKLLTTKKKEILYVARIRTLTLLRGLDGVRKGFVLHFLHEAGLIWKEKTIINLQAANLENVVLRGEGLSNVSLSASNLSNADLAFANLSNTDLKYSHLADAKMKGINLSNACLLGTVLINANLSFANLKNADLVDANLDNANLAGANLTDAIITQNQLDRTFSLKGAVMPDGTKHE